jgi:hypothetical protein
VFWHDGAPSLEGGIFTAHWALKHACELNPGGIKEPINIAVLHRNKDGDYVARMLPEEELNEHKDMEEAASLHFRQFREILEGKSVDGSKPPAPPKAGS